MSCKPKQNAYWITFVAYASIHALRMCYAFNKVNLKRQFLLTEFYLGFLDAILYISYAIGVLVRYEVFEGNSNMKKVYFITSILLSVCFGLIAYISLIEEIGILHVKVAKILLTLGIFGFGFFHMAIYQICGSVISGYYDSKKQSAKLGFWASSTSVGNIVGFFISNLIVHEFLQKWQITYFMMAIFSLVMGFVVYYALEIPAEDETYKEDIYRLETDQQKIIHKQIPKKQQQYKEIRLRHWLNFIKKVIQTNPEARYTYGAYLTVKASVYTFLMWFPIFLVSKNLQHVSGYISTLFDIGGVLGGYLIGKLHRVNYDAVNEGEQQQKGLVGILLKFRNTIIIVIVTGVILGFMFVDASLVIYCPLTLLIGFFLGGTFNNISSHQIFKIADNHMLYTDMLLNLSVGISCFMIGLIQLLTAFLMKWNDSGNRKSQPNYGLFFIVLLTLMIICVGIMCKRAYFEEKKEKKIMEESID